MNDKAYNIYTIVGSLREKSYNQALMKSFRDAAPKDFIVTPGLNLSELPYFNPDIDDVVNPIPSVHLFRESLKKADCVVIFSPEYAHNIPGVLKNALDWIVASGELVNKPVVVTNTSTTYLGGNKAHESLKNLVNVLSADLLEEASFTVDSAFHKFDESGFLIDEAIAQKLNSIFEIIRKHILKSIPSS